MRLTILQHKLICRAGVFDGEIGELMLVDLLLKNCSQNRLKLASRQNKTRFDLDKLNRRLDNPKNTAHLLNAFCGKYFRASI
jgi:hypothetical protein